MAATIATSTLEDFWFGEGADEQADRGAAASVAALVARIHGVKPLPVAAHKLMRVSRDPDTPLSTIAKVLESDPGLLARVLRLVNSAAFALRVPCKSAKAAVTLLGSKRIAEVATASAILDMFDDATGEVRGVLGHALAIAAIMKRLAHKCEMSVEDAFTCGLLHDVGKLMQLQVGDGDYAALMASAEGSCERIHVREREIYGFDHGVLAGHMLRAWNIPSPVPEAVGLHHHLARAYEVGGDVGKMVHMLHVSELLLERVKGIRPDDDDLEALLREESMGYLALNRDDLISLWGDLHAAIESSRRVLSNASADEPDPSAGDRTSGVRKSIQPDESFDPWQDPAPRAVRFARKRIAGGVALAIGLLALAAAISAIVH